MKKNISIFLTSFLLGCIFSLFLGKMYLEKMWKELQKPEFIQAQKLDLKDFWKVYDTIQDEYFTSEKIEQKDLVDGAIAGMVKALGDDHSEYMNPEVTEKFEASLSWDFEGIGAVVEKVPLGVKIERIINWSPAKKYGVRSGDIVVKANGTELESLDIYDAIDKIKGPAGTSVLLDIIRPGQKKHIEITVIRAKIQIPSVEEKYFQEDDIAYIALNMYGEWTAAEFKKALENVKKSGAKGLIIDVRDNGGGYLQSAVEILWEFIENKEVLVKTRYKNSYFDQNYFSLNDGDIYDKKIVVLINGNSASASEITAWALREYDKAILIGQKSYGKWSVQQPFTMEDGSLLKLTVAKWFTPKGKNITKEGIQPDIEVEFKEEDYEKKYDRQLEEAKKLLKIFREKETIGLSIEQYKKEAEKNQSVNEKWKE